MSVFRSGTNSSVCLFLVAFISIVLLLANVVPLGKWKHQLPIWSITCNNVSTGAKSDQLDLPVLLRRLVGGEDRVRLKATRLACHSDLQTDVCVIDCPVVIDTSSLKVYAPSNQFDNQTQHVIRPYALKGDKLAMSSVSPVEIILTKNTTSPAPACQHIHNAPAIVFSSSGFTGNTFHEFNDVIIPLFLTSRHFKSRVHFVVSDFRPWFVQKYLQIMNHLSNYEVINPSGNGSVHCFPGAVIGLHFHGNLNLNTRKLPTGHSVLGFKQFLRESYNMKTTNNQSQRKRPVLILISRTNSRTFLNQDQMVKLMDEIGFEVVVTRTERMYHLEKFAEVMNSCSVLVGAHGAGLTNSLFLPQGAVLMQVVPLGLDWAATNYFGEPAREMGLKYLEYKITAEESSLSRLYGPDDPVVTNPASLLLKGYRAARALYVDGQNLTVDLERFRGTVAEAYRLLQNTEETTS